MPARGGAVAEENPVADEAVVSDVGVCHEDVVVPDRRQAAPAAGSAVHGHALAEDVAVADQQPRMLAAELEILRIRPIDANG